MVVKMTLARNRAVAQYVILDVMAVQPPTHLRVDILYTRGENLQDWSQGCSNSVHPEFVVTGTIKTVESYFFPHN